MCAKPNQGQSKEKTKNEKRNVNMITQCKINENMKTCTKHAQTHMHSYEDTTKKQTHNKTHNKTQTKKKSDMLTTLITPFLEESRDILQELTNDLKTIKDNNNNSNQNIIKFNQTQYYRLTTDFYVFAGLLKGLNNCTDFSNNSNDNSNNNNNSNQCMMKHIENILQIIMGCSNIFIQNGNETLNFKNQNNNDNSKNIKKMKNIMYECICEVMESILESFIFLNIEKFLECLVGITCNLIIETQSLSSVRILRKMISLFAPNNPNITNQFFDILNQCIQFFKDSVDIELCMPSVTELFQCIQILMHHNILMDGQLYQVLVCHTLGIQKKMSLFVCVCVFSECFSMFLCVSECLL